MEIEAIKAAVTKRTQRVIISPASGMQPPLVQRRSSDAKPTSLLSTLESYDSRSLTNTVCASSA
jgi:hypothetical protein